MTEDLTAEVAWIPLGFHSHKCLRNTSIIMLRIDDAGQLLREDDWRIYGTVYTWLDAFAVLGM